jgi:hypothetical protein
VTLVAAGVVVPVVVVVDVVVAVVVAVVILLVADTLLTLLACILCSALLVLIALTSPTMFTKPAAKLLTSFSLPSRGRLLTRRTLPKLTVRTLSKAIPWKRGRPTSMRCRMLEGRCGRWLPTCGSLLLMVFGEEGKRNDANDLDGNLAGHFCLAVSLNPFLLSVVALLSLTLS